jgi:putative N6-adenine-specific DNA methylase
MPFDNKRFYNDQHTPKKPQDFKNDNQQHASKKITDHRFIAKTFQGLETVLAEEINRIGGKNIKILTRGVEFSGDMYILYRINLESRTAMRVLMPIHTFHARNEAELYDGVRDIDWTKYMELHDTFAIDAVVHSLTFRHSKFVALKTKDAVADQFRDRFGSRPNVDVATPTLQISIHIHNNACTILLDSSGQPLFKRGVEREALEAPINEILAAGMIFLSGWKGDMPFIDPMCGSGTILREAAMIATNTPPTWHRTNYGFMNWKTFDEDLWLRVRKRAEIKIIPLAHPIEGYDKDFQAVRVSERNNASAGLSDLITVTRRPFEKLLPATPTGMIITNPPYDERMKTEDTTAFYQMMGEHLQKNFKGHTAWLISSNLAALQNNGLRSKKKIELYNGALECNFVQYSL